MEENEFIGRLRSRENFARAVLNKIRIDRRRKSIGFCIITDSAFTPQDEE